MAIMEIRLLADKAVAEGLDKDADFQRRMAFLQQRALHSELIDKDVGAKITDEEVRARYDKQMADTPPVNEVKARHILVKTKEEADAIIKQLDGGAEFEELANEHTTDPSGKTTGGDLGYFAPGQMVPEFETAAFALEIGSYTKDAGAEPVRLARHQGRGQARPAAAGLRHRQGPDPQPRLPREIFRHGQAICARRPRSTSPIPT